MVDVTNFFNINKFDQHNGSVEKIELGDKTKRNLKFFFHGQYKLLTATIFFCMVSYARNTYSNILQIAIRYFAFANNSTKQIMEILHYLGLQVTYKTIQTIF